MPQQDPQRRLSFRLLVFQAVPFGFFTRIIAIHKEEQEIAALWRLYVDINNGGLIQFFCNWGYECFCYAMRGLKRIADNSLYELLSDAYYNVLEKFRNDSRLKAYWDIPEYLTRADEEILDFTDAKFYEAECERLTQMAYEFYHQTSGKTASAVSD